MCMSMYAAHELLMKALREPKHRRSAVMSLLMYTFLQLNDTEKHSVGNEADRSPSNSCQEQPFKTTDRYSIRSWYVLEFP